MHRDLVGWYGRVLIPNAATAVSNTHSIETERQAHSGHVGENLISHRPCISEDGNPSRSGEDDDGGQ